MDEVAAQQVSHAGGAGDVEIGGQPVLTGGARSGVVESSFADEQGLVSHFQDQVGFALTGTGGQGAGNGDTGQVIGDQQGTIQCVSV